MLREPAQFVQSFYDFENLDFQLDKQCRLTGNGCDQMYEKQGVHSWLVLDNYFIRMLLGHRAESIKMGGIKKKHAQKAIKMLKKFDLVTAIEQLDDKGAELLKDKLGWSQTMSRDNADPDTDDDSSTASIHLDEDLPNFVKWDKMVYDYFID